jgi:hypothetical protein
LKFVGFIFGEIRIRQWVSRWFKIRVHSRPSVVEIPLAREKFMLRKQPRAA